MLRFQASITFLFSCLAAQIVGAGQPIESVSRPNVLFIIFDDMNDWIDLLDPAAPIKTPHLQKLGARGTLFTNAYCSSPACNPSRVSLLTGLRPSNSGVYGNRTDWRAALPTTVTFPQHFKNNGYHVSGAGKIFHHHLAGAFHDPQAFHNFLAMPDPPDSPMPMQKLNQLNWYGSKNTDWGAWPKNEKDHVDVKTADYCIEQIQQQRSEPQLWAAGIFRPHMPFFAPEKAFAQYPIDNLTMPQRLEDDLADIPTGGQKLLNSKKWFWQGMTKAEKETNGTWKKAVQAYQACTSFADEQLGRLIAALDKSGHAENTIIVVCSDHGYHLGEKNHWEKFALWEKSTHIPMIVVAPNMTKPNSTCHACVDLTAIYPTLLELCSLTAPHNLDGKSLVPLLKDPKSNWSHPAIMTYGQGNHAVRQKQWRFIQYADGTQELYDHRTDPHEHNNLAQEKENAAVIAQLRKYLPSSEKEPAADFKKSTAK